MVRVNKKYLAKELKSEAWGRFWRTLKKSESEETLLAKLGRFFTPTEIAMLEKRLAILVLLERNASYRTIGRTIDVSANTISFVKHNLTRKQVVHRRYSPMRNPKPKKKLPFFPPRVGHGRWLRAKLNG